MTHLIKCDVIDHVALLTLNREGSRNALSQQLLYELAEQIEKIDHNKEIYCTVITGAGDRAFCAGADLKERRGMSDTEVIQAVKQIGKTVQRIELMKMPVIAAINGAAFGGGLELALACDIRIAKEGVKMGLTETSLAIIPGAGGTQRLLRLVGLGKAKELIFTAQPMTASEALEIGLVEQLTTDDVVDKALEMAQTIANNGPIALEQAKRAIQLGAETDLTTGLSIEYLCYEKTIPTEDRQEGLLAFKEKRKPIYYGK